MLDIVGIRSKVDVLKNFLIWMILKLTCTFRVSLLMCPWYYQSNVIMDRIYVLLEWSVEDSIISQTGITCLKLTIRTLEQGVKYVQS